VFTHGRAHKEGGDEVLARDIAEHVSLSKTQVAHGAQTDPERIVENGQLGMRLYILASFRPEFINTFARNDA
jgi:hypothetical protein